MLSNKAMPGLLKIGYTTRSIEGRISELHSTGVPSRFEVEFYCEVGHAANLEAEIHKKLKSYRFEKEFFRCPTKKAVEVVKLTICEGRHIFYGSGGRSASVFLTNDEQREITRLREYNLLQSKLLQEQRENERKQAQLARITRDLRIKEYVTRLDKDGLIAKQILYPYQKIVEDKLYKYDGLKTLGFISLSLATAGIGGLIAMVLTDDGGELGRLTKEAGEVIKLMTPTEKKFMIEYVSFYREIKSLNDKDSKEIFKNAKNSCYIGDHIAKSLCG